MKTKNSNKPKNKKHFNKSKSKQHLPKITTSTVPEPETFILQQPSSTNNNETEIDTSQFKIAKYWKGTNLIETKNTNGDIEYISQMNCILSLSNGKVISLEISSLQITKTFSSPDEDVVGFVYNAKKQEVICLMNTSMLRVFDYESEQCINKFKLNKTVGKIVKLDPSYNFLAVVTAQNTILIYDAESFNLECTFIGHSGIIYNIAFNPVIEKFILYSCSEDNSVKVWNVLMKKCVATLEPHTSSVRHIALTNDGSFLISGTFDNKVFIWKLMDYYQSELPKPKIYEVNYQFESMMYFTRSINNANVPSLLLGCEDGTICEFNLQSGEVVDVSQSVISQPIVQLVYVNDMKKLFVLTSEQTLIYLNVNIVHQSIINAEVDKIYPCYCQELLSVKYISPSSDNFVFASNDNVLKYYDTKKSNVSLYEGHTDFIMSITVKQNLIVTTSKDNTIRLWSFTYDNNEDEDNNFICECIGVLKGHSETVNCSDIALKKHKHVVSGCKDGSIKLWDIHSIIDNDNEYDEINESLFSVAAHEDEVNVVKFSPNEKLIASGAYDKKIKIYSSTNLSLLNTLSGHRRGITDLSFSLYAKVLISSSTDKTIKLWNLSDYTCLNTFDGHLSSVLKVEWIYYGTHIISAGADGLIKFWNIKNSECINTIDAHEGKIWAMDVNTEYEQTLNFITGGTDAKVISWKDITQEKEVELIQAQEDKLNKEDELRNLNYNKQYINALKLSLELKHKNNFLISFKNYVDDVITRKTNQGVSSGKSDIDIIIENRKIIDKELPEEDYMSKYKECIKEILANKEIRELIVDNKEQIIEIIRDYNIKQSTFFYAQVLLKLMLKISKIDSFYGKGNAKDDEDEKVLNKKRKRRTMPKNYIENLEVVKMYSEKHLERINREMTKAFMLDYSIEKMKLV